MLTKEEVRHIAELARIDLTQEEVAQYQKDLSSILAYFEQLQKIDTNTIEPIGHITGMTNIYREDKDEEFGDLGRKGIMENVPDTKDNYIRVKAVL